MPYNDERRDRAREVARSLLRGRTSGNDVDDFACALLAYEGEHPNTIQYAYLQEQNEQLSAERDELRGEQERLRAAINIDRSGLAAALSHVRRLCSGWYWLGGDTWGSYSWEEQTIETLRKEMATCLDQIEDVAHGALGRSGDLAVEVLRGGVDIRAVFKELEDLRARTKNDYCVMCGGFHEPLACAVYAGFVESRTKDDSDKCG